MTTTGLVLAAAAWLYYTVRSRSRTDAAAAPRNRLRQAAVLALLTVLVIAATHALRIRTARKRQHNCPATGRPCGAATPLQPGGRPAAGCGCTTRSRMRKTAG